MSTAATHHIISNVEIGLTECGRLVSYHDADEPTPWKLSTGSQVAIWDNDEPPAGSSICTDCAEACDS